MNGFCLGYNSDRGATHAVNQDSIFIKSFSDADKKILIAGLFDGMGGHSEGERVSGAAAQAVSGWADANKHLFFEEDRERIADSLTSALDRLNEKIRVYGKRVGAEVGTTAAILVIWPSHYLSCNIGDSRIYHISDGTAKQITEDHSLVADLVRAGLLSEDQAGKHPQRNVLTQALGILERITPHSCSGRYESNDVFLLCCDGFYHELSGEEIQSFYHVKSNSRLISEELIRTTELVISRGETDNITGIIIKAASEG